jgi:hypothetical protein
VDGRVVSSDVVLPSTRSECMVNRQVLKLRGSAPPRRPQEDGRARTPDLPARPCGDGTFPGDVMVTWRQ